MKMKSTAGSRCHLGRPPAMKLLVLVVMASLLILLPAVIDSFEVDQVQTDIKYYSSYSTDEFEAATDRSSLDVSRKKLLKPKSHSPPESKSHKSHPPPKPLPTPPKVISTPPPPAPQAQPPPPPPPSPSPSPSPPPPQGQPNTSPPQTQTPPPPSPSPPPPNPPPPPPPPPSPSPPPPNPPPSPPPPPSPSPPPPSQYPPPPNPPSPPPPPPPSQSPPPPPPPPPAALAPPPPSPAQPWSTNYINLYTPMPNGGLVISADGMEADLRITSVNQSFGHFESKYRFLYGYFSMYLKLVPGESAGVITTYYFSSPAVQAPLTDVHDEVDFEFLGNTSGNPITLQTNVYVNGTGNREQRHNLPFDPTADFHKYSLLWNPNLIIWFVDDSVIRVFNNESAATNTSYPTTRPMAVQCSIWDGSDWATQGGLVKLNFSYAPFVAKYQGFNGVDGCPVCSVQPTTACDNIVDYSNCTNPTLWYNQQTQLTDAQILQLQTHRQTNLTYDYCKDTNRFPGGLPKECPYNSYGT